MAAPVKFRESGHVVCEPLQQLHHHQGIVVYSWVVNIDAMMKYCFCKLLCLHASQVATCLEHMTRV